MAASARRCGSLHGAMTVPWRARSLSEAPRSSACSVSQTSRLSKRPRPRHSPGREPQRNGHRPPRRAAAIAPAGAISWAAPRLLDRRGDPAVASAGAVVGRAPASGLPLREAKRQPPTDRSGCLLRFALATAGKRPRRSARLADAAKQQPTAPARHYPYRPRGIVGSATTGRELSRARASRGWLLLARGAIALDPGRARWGRGSA